MLKLQHLRVPCHFSKSISMKLANETAKVVVLEIARQQIVGQAFSIINFGSYPLLASTQLCLS